MMKVRKFIDIIIRSLLGLFGFSCSEPVGEYGCPYVEYEVSGYVTNSKGEPVQNVDVTMQGRESLLTDQKGYYSFEVDDTGFGSDVQFRFEGNPTLYEPFDTLIPREKIKFEGGSGWYKGKATIELNVVLKDRGESEE